MYRVGVASSGITFIPNFVKVEQLVLKLKMDTHTHTHTNTNSMVI